MSAIDTFERFLVTEIARENPALREYLADQRSYLLTLRSEDERQRFVERVLREVRTMAAAKS